MKEGISVHMPDNKNKSQWLCQNHKLAQKSATTLHKEHFWKLSVTVCPNTVQPCYPPCTPLLLILVAKDY
jgi:hypothetical protein